MGAPKPVTGLGMSMSVQQAIARTRTVLATAARSPVSPGAGAGEGEGEDHGPCLCPCPYDGSESPTGSGSGSGDGSASADAHPHPGPGPGPGGALAVQIAHVQGHADPQANGSILTGGFSGPGPEAGVGPGLSGLPHGGGVGLGVGGSLPVPMPPSSSPCRAYISNGLTARSDMEEADTNKTKVSDSAYSTSCNSRSQRSSGSSKSRQSGSSNSSGYSGNNTALRNVTEVAHPSATKRNKDKKKKAGRSGCILPAPTEEVVASSTAGSSDVPDALPQNAETENIENATDLVLGPELVFGGRTSPHEDLQMAAINQTLSFIQKLKSTSEEHAIVTDAAEDKTPKIDSDPVRQINPEKVAQPKEEFTTIISMSDGIVKHTSTGITDVLGFPSDMWVGRSITDFVQPKDRNAFASHITSGVASPLTQFDKDSGRKTPFFCSLRRYRGLLSCGFGVKDKSVQYRPCRLLLTFREHLSGLPLANEPQNESSSMTSTVEGSSRGREQPHIYLVVMISPISSAYKNPEEALALPTFATRLLDSTQLSEVDPECVPYLGFLPQDMIGRSVLDFYHPEDISSLKDVYEAVIKEQGVPFSSKPYRFRSQNGGYVLLETEWSSFSNPWSRKLEFIVALHRVLKGPVNPDVFAPPSPDSSAPMTEDVLKEITVIQEQIQTIVNEAVSVTVENTKKRNLSKRCKVLASFMDSMTEEKKKPELRLDMPPEEQSFSERESVMLGGISPHHEYYDSKSSSETPPSYNQLNYNDNIQRFFESKPKTTRSLESSKGKEGSAGKNSPEQSSLGSGDSGSGGGSGGLTGSQDSATSLSSNSFQQPILTEALLTRHNENMEKRLVQKHREQRSKGDKRDKYQKQPGAPVAHGVKRIGSQSWEKEGFKGSKHLHMEPSEGVEPASTSAAAGAGVGLGAGAGAGAGAGTGARAETGPGPGPGAGVVAVEPADGRVSGAGAGAGAGAASGMATTTTIPSTVNSSIPPIYQNPASSVWPPFSVTVTPVPSQTAGAFGSFPLGTSPNVMPMYFMPGNPLGRLAPQEPHTVPGLPSRHPFLPSPFLPNPSVQLVYQHIPPSVLYPPLSMMHPAPTMLPTSLFPPGACQPAEPVQSSPMVPRLLMQAQAAAVGAGAGAGAGAGPRPQAPQASVQTSSQQLQLQQQQQQQQQPNEQQPTAATEEGGSYHMQCKFQRPSSQATSVKAEPGSALGSVASASRRALSASPTKNKSPSHCEALSPDEDKAMEDSNQCSECVGGEGDGSYYSSLYSFICTDNSDESMRTESAPSSKEPLTSKGTTSVDSSQALSIRSRPLRLGPPPWMEGVSMNSETLYQYQLGDREISDVLSADLMALTKIEQPTMVNDQLSQLYEDLALEGAPSCLMLEEGVTSSSGSGSGSGSSSEDWAGDLQDKSKKERKMKRRSVRYGCGYGRLIMIFEENGPIPPPVTSTTVTTVSM